MDKHARGEHYYSPQQTSDYNKKKIEIKLADDTFTLLSASGLFSKDELDFGTKLLIENVTPQGTLLDLGCGNGVIGISFLRRHPDITVTFSDVNGRAIELTKENLAQHKLKATVIPSDLFNKIPEHFDTIVTNPPYAAGRALSYLLIEQAQDHLNKGGKLYVVARHQKGGSMLEKKMKDTFGNVGTIVKRGGFRVYMSEKK